MRNDKRLLVAGWSLTKMCNLRCIHCYSASGKQHKDELTYEQAIKVADKLGKAGVIAVNFGGGECALRKDFIDICMHLKKLGIKISYTTNGTTFDLIRDHLDLFDDIGVSIDFADKNKHDWFRGMPGTFDKAIATIRELVKKGVDTEIVTCLTKLNCAEPELKKLHALAKELDVDYWRLNRFRATGRGDDSRNSLSLTKKDLKLAYTFLSEQMHTPVSIPDPVFRAAFGGNYYIEGDPSGNTAFRIQSNGEVTPSVFLSISGGNIKDKELGEILDSPIFNSIRNRQPRGKCKTCPAYFHCKGGDAGASFLAYGHFDGPDPLCWVKHPLMAKRYLPSKWNIHELYLCTVYVPIKGGRQE